MLLSFWIVHHPSGGGPWEVGERLREVPQQYLPGVLVPLAQAGFDGDQQAARAQSMLLSTACLCTRGRTHVLLSLLDRRLAFPQACAIRSPVQPEACRAGQGQDRNEVPTWCT